MTTITITARPRVKFTLVESGIALGAPGLSAYEMWLAEGNTGTEQEFLDSLVGEPGTEIELQVSGGGNQMKKTFALLLLPTVAGAHIIKSILKMSSQIPFWRHALSDTKGIETAQRIAAGTLELNKSAPDALYPGISLMAAAILLIALAATMQIFCKSAVVQKHTGGVKFILLLSVLAYWSIFGLTIFNWRFG